MLTIEGLPADSIDKVMNLFNWAKSVSQQENPLDANKTEMIYAGIGKPTYPAHPRIVEYLADFWSKHGHEALDYGTPQGDKEPRELMAKAMSDWYGQTINENEILFTVGGASSISSVFSALQKYHADTPNFRVITPYPYYTLYCENKLHLHPIHVMKSAGYRLTAKCLLDSIKSAEQLAESDSGFPRALLLCEPNNPLGTVLDAQELQEIIGVLKDYPKLTIILDEAYAELVLSGEKHVSLLTLAPPELKERIIVMRSGTKALSAAGERLAITIAFNKQLMQHILEEGIRKFGHAPRSHQGAYATAMLDFTDDYRRDLNKYYGERVQYVSERLAAMGASMPDEAYRVQGAFYVMGDFSDLLGGYVPKAARVALGCVQIARTDEEMIFSLLFTDKIMISPASYYGIEQHKGYVRITCSAEMNLLKLLMDRIERRLQQARIKKNNYLAKVIEQQWNELKNLDSSQYETLQSEYVASMKIAPVTALELKKQNKTLQNLLVTIKRLSYKSMNAEVRLIQRTFKEYLNRKSRAQEDNELDKNWNSFVFGKCQISPEPGTTVGTFFKRLPADKRLEFAPWKEYLLNKDNLNLPPGVNNSESEVADKKLEQEPLDSVERISIQSRELLPWEIAAQSDAELLNGDLQANDEEISARFLINLMSNPTINFCSFFLLFVVLTSGAMALFGLASAPVLGLAATLVVGSAASILGFGFFSQPIKALVSEQVDDERFIPSMNEC